MTDVAGDAPSGHALENGVGEEATVAWQENGARWGWRLKHGVLLAIVDGDGDLLKLSALVDDLGEGQDEGVRPLPVLESDVELGGLANGADLDEFLQAWELPGGANSLDAWEDDVQGLAVKDGEGLLGVLLVQEKHGRALFLEVWKGRAGLPFEKAGAEDLARVGPVKGVVVDHVAGEERHVVEHGDGGALHAALNVLGDCVLDADDGDFLDAADDLERVDGLAHLIAETAIPVARGALGNVLDKTGIV